MLNNGIKENLTLLLIMILDGKMTHTYIVIKMMADIFHNCFSINKLYV